MSPASYILSRIFCLLLACWCVGVVCVRAAAAVSAGGVVAHAHTKRNPQINKATLGMLKRVEPYIAWGYPNQKSVRELVYKRGHAKVKGGRIPLTDNKIVEAALGKHGLICVEDVVR